MPTTDMSRRLKTTDVRRIQALAGQGLTYAQIREQTGWSRDTIGRYASGLGIRRGRPLSEAQRAEVKRLRAEERLPLKEIERRLGVSNTAILKHAGRLSYKGRKVEEADRRRIAALVLDEGVSCLEAGRAEGLHRMTVYRLVAEERKRRDRESQ